MDFVKSEKKYFNLAFGLALFTIFYNILEGVVALYFGYEDESLALFGFGADSFIEVISGLGIVHMITRIKHNPHSNRDRFEKTALRITGVAFYLLTAGLVVSSVYNIWTGHTPDTTFWGLVISVVSIIMMWALVWGKRKAGHELNSEPILADANCTLVCLYMSIVLLLSSGIYELTGIGFIDSLGGLCLAWFSFSEGRECFEKINSDKYCSC
ncbi:MAG: cation transporter [Salinimicrobium sp.]